MANRRQVIGNEQWPRSCPYLNPMKISPMRSDARSFLKVKPKPKTVSELKVALEKLSDIFPDVQLKSCPEF